MSALSYNHKQNYSREQIATIQRGLGVPADGLWSAQTVDAVIRWQRVQPGFVVDGKVGRQTFAALERAVAGGQQLALAPRSSISTVGVWLGQRSLSRIDEDVQYCRQHGINRFDLVVNDCSDRRTLTPFRTYDTAKIVELCRRATDAGIEVHLMSWIMPYAEFIDAAAEQLIPLCRATGAASLQWDAEEPWMRAQAALPHADAAARVAEAFAELPCPMGVNGIGYAPIDAFGPLAERCTYLVPQCYATSTSEAQPESVVTTCVNRWRRAFGADKLLIPGLAAYRQLGIPGHTPQTAMATTLATVRAYGYEAVVYWSLRWIKDNPEVAAFIASIRNPIDPAASERGRYT